MTRPRPGIGSELLPLSLILASLAATLVLVIAMHRRAAVGHKPAESPPPVQVVVAPPPVPEEPPQAPEPEPPPPPSPPQEDPTKKALARLSAAEAEEQRAAQDADRRAEALEAARRAALAESQRIRNRLALIRSQVDHLATKAQNLDLEVEALALERDVLAQERDAAKAALAKAMRASSYAVLPHKGPNGPWRRPVVIECVNGTAKLQPDGPEFTLLDLSSMMGMRASPLVVAVARKVLALDGVPSPDGAPAVPYILFVVRPDGIRPYYDARARLEPLGIAFGYELVDQDWEIDFSDPDNPTEGITTPPHSTGLGSRVADAGAGGGALSWPGEQTPRRGSGTQDKDAPQSFVWSGRGQGRGNGGGVPDGTGAGGHGPRGQPNRGIGGGTGANRVDQGPGGATGGGTPARRGLPGGDGLQPFPNRPGTGGRSVALRSQSGGSPGMSGNPPGGGGGQPNDPLDGGTGNLTGQAREGGFGGTRAQSATERGLGQSPGLVPLSPDGIPVLESPGAGDGSPGAQANAPAGGGSLAPGTAGSPGGSAESKPSSAGGGSLAPGTTSNPGGSAASKPSSASGGSLATGTPSDPGGSAESKPSSAGGGSLAPGTPSDPGGSAESNPSSPAGSGGPPASANLAQGAGLSSPSSAPPGGIPLAFPAPPTGFPSLSSASSAAGSNGLGSGSPSSLQPNRIPILPSDLVADQPFGESSSGGSDGALSGKKGDPNSGMMSGKKSSYLKPKRVEVPFEITVACGPSGVLIYPGGYRLSAKALQDEGLLTKELQAILQLRRQVDPLIVPQPSITFLIEPGGRDLYWKVRKQVLLSKIDWPMSIQLGDTSLLGFSPRETRR